MQNFKLTARQLEANAMLAGDAMHNMLFGGSRSGKTFLLVRAVVIRAMKAPDSRHAILRFRFNHIKASIILDTFPKVMALCFPDIAAPVDKTDWYAKFPNGSEIWFGGLDDKLRTEKILGQEYATGYLNECSQIPRGSRDLFVTRLAQKVMTKVEGQEPEELKLKMYYDCNPPNKLHWTYKLFKKKIDPETNDLLPDPQQYVSMQVNPKHNIENLPASYMATLEGMSARLRKRFLDGEFADANPNQLFADEVIDKWRVIGGKLPDMVRVVVAVDPSGSGDQDNAANDAIGIVCGGLGTDGVVYVTEDLTVKAGPATWGRVATTAYDRLLADAVVGEVNFGGAMVEHVIQTARRDTNYKSVTASRGKAVRAEPVSSLYEQGRVRHVGFFPELEEELAGFTTGGYIGENSPNRADAVVWLVTELMPGVVNHSTDEDMPMRFKGWG